MPCSERQFLHPSKRSSAVFHVSFLIFYNYYHVEKKCRLPWISRYTESEMPFLLWVIPLWRKAYLFGSSPILFLSASLTCTRNRGAVARLLHWYRELCFQLLYHSKSLYGVNNNNSYSYGFHLYSPLSWRHRIGNPTDNFNFFVIIMYYKVEKRLVVLMQQHAFMGSL